MAETPITFEVPICSVCRRKRTVGTSEYPMDAYDYSPLQVLSNSALGWYSGDDGQVCPECMTKTMRGQ